MNPADTATLSALELKQLSIVQSLLKQHGWTDGTTHDAKLCVCDHRLQGSGAVFFQSVGILNCQRCEGWQVIRKPVS